MVEPNDTPAENNPLPFPEAENQNPTETQAAANLPETPEEPILARLLLESSAQGLFVLNEDGITERAGDQSSDSFAEAELAIRHHWNPAETGDLVRYVRLEAIAAETLIYATPLPGDEVLGLIYDPAMPLSRVRAQAVRVVRDLASAKVVPATEGTIHPVGGGQVVLPVDQEAAAGEAGLVHREIAASWLPEEELRPDAAEPSTPDILLQAEEDAKPLTGGRDDAGEITAQTNPGKYTSDLLLRLGEEERKPKPSESIFITGVLVPGQLGCFLTGKLVETLQQSLAHLCKAMEWRLAGLAIRPNYCQWTVGVPLEMAAEDVALMIRRHTGAEMAADWKDGAEPDFWAEESPVFPGERLPDPRVLLDILGSRIKPPEQTGNPA